MANRFSKNFSKNCIIKIFFIIVIVTAIIIFTLFINREKYSDNIEAIIGGQKYYLEVAQTDESREKGLSGRNELCLNCGMFFPFQISGKYPFWMKDTHIPLDIIWLNSKFQIVKIITAIDTDSEKIYTNKKFAKYAIELNANESFKLGLNIGDTIQISKL